jgi:hypothetical protein
VYAYCVIVTHASPAANARDSGLANTKIPTDTMTLGCRIDQTKAARVHAYAKLGLMRTVCILPFCSFPPAGTVR